MPEITENPASRYTIHYDLPRVHQPDSAAAILSPAGFAVQYGLRVCRRARWVQWLISVWLLLVMAVLVLSMFCGRIESSVLIALLTTTTVNILGLPFIILKGLFDK